MLTCIKYKKWYFEIIIMSIAIIGGGTGTSFLARVMSTAHYIVSVFDSGGSTGILRNNTPAVGDIRRVLSSLGANLEYRPGTHPVGNLLLQSRLEKGDSLQDAVDYIRRLHDIPTKVYPITLSSRHLVAQYKFNRVVGEHLIDTTLGKYGNPMSIRLDSPALMHRIPRADTVVLAPGDVWTSLIPNFLVMGFKDWVKQSKIILCVNSKQKLGETMGWTLQEYVMTIEHYLGKPVDIIVADNQTEFSGTDERLYTYDLTVDGEPDANLYKEAICKHI